MVNLAQQAISAALAGKWESAKKINSEIVKATPGDVDALNRLAKAHAELGNSSLAQRATNKVLRIEPHNSIAKKSLNKWKGVSKNGRKTSIFSTGSGADAFLEEPGKTKIVVLINLGSPKIVSNLNPGEEVKILPHAHRISINTIQGDFIGRLPDDLSAHLRKLIKHGNEYSAMVKSVDIKCVRIFIKEIKRSENLKHVASFSTEKINYVSFTPPELIRKKNSEPAKHEDDN